VKSGKPELQRFKEEAEKTDAKVVVVSSLSEAQDYVLEYIRERNIENLVYCPDSAGSLEELLKRFKFPSILSSKSTAREIIAKAELGIWLSNYGIAETGTLVFVTSEANDMLTTALPLYNIVFLRSEQIYPTSKQLLSELQQSFIRHNGPFQVSFITGPSRTADIECEVTIGVHGPKELVIFIYD
jgi:L-lactate dehydrogenase complex protein LldG